jgi:hypothetical protein
VALGVGRPLLDELPEAEVTGIAAGLHVTGQRE